MTIRFIGAGGAGAPALQKHLNAQKPAAKPAVAPAKDSRAIGGGTGAPALKKHLASH